MSRKKQIIRQYVSDELFTDREEYLDYFYEAARKASRRRIRSTVLLGRRRMGKTEIFTRVVNRLFFEQDPADPLSVVPVYYSFEDESLDRKEFAVAYLENFTRHYVAFYLQQPEIIEDKIFGKELLTLLTSAKSTHPFPKSLDRLAYWLDAIERDQVPTPERLAVQTPGHIADLDESGIVVFLDEFQNIRMPHQDFSILGFMQNAVESPYGPHFVTGSAMSILIREIIGVGPLYGRFDSDRIEPLSEYWGAELAKKAAAYYDAEMADLMAPVIADRCGGNPFYISAVIQQAAKRRQPLIDEEAINSMLAIDISSGLIWTELSTQVNGWIRRVNNQRITKWILYLSALEESECISLERIQTELQKREGKFVELDEIRDVLILLSHGDLLEFLVLGDSFQKTDDPILLEFLRVWGRIEVERQNRARVRNELLVRYRRLRNKFNEYRGYMAEVFMGQALLNSHEFDTYPGHFFNSSQDIQLRRPVVFVHHRVRLDSGTSQEIDILASLGGDMWVCQSKWETTRKVGVAVVKELLGHGNAVQADYDPPILHKWIFAHEGLTKGARELAEKEGVFWSDRKQLDGLLTYLGLRKLPEILDEKQ